MPFSGFGDLQPQFAADLQRMIAAQGGGITPFSGFRSPARQAELYKAAVAKYGSEQAARKWVAPPGKSHHGFGTAVDLRYADEAARTWAHANAARYNLRFPMAHEPWHIEPIEAGASMGAQPGVTTQQPPPSLAGIGSPNVAQPYPGVFPPPPPEVDISQRPMTPGRFLMMMAAGQNPLRMMVFQGIGNLLAGA
jgi:hypothetical protein